MSQVIGSLAGPVILQRRIAEGFSAHTPIRSTLGGAVGTLVAVGGTSGVGLEAGGVAGEVRVGSTVGAAVAVLAGGVVG